MIRFEGLIGFVSWFHLEGLFYESDGFLAGAAVNGFNVRKLAIELIQVRPRIVHVDLIGRSPAGRAETLLRIEIPDVLRMLHQLPSGLAASSEL